MIEIIVAITIYMFLHTSTVAACVRLCDVQITEIGYGVGPKLINKENLKIGLFPITGWVSALDSRDRELADSEKELAFNHKPWLIQVIVPLSGCTILLAVSIALLGDEAVSSFLSAFGQIITGSVKPLSQGQSYIESIDSFIKQNTLLTIIAITQTKIVAFNLLPLSILNGGQSLVNLVKMGKPHASWEKLLAKLSFVLGLLIVVSWSLAFISYLL
jgi:membrane-associated protease RseP (regulator of RpoE activity)